MSPDKPKTTFQISSRRQKRVEAKKRKVQALLHLIENESETKKLKVCKAEQKIPDKTYEEEVKLLREMKSLFNEKMSKQMPSFSFTESGLQAQIDFELHKQEQPPDHNVSPLLVEDIQHFLLKSLLGSCNKTYTPRWCKLGMEHLVSHVLLLIVDGVSKNSVFENMDCFPNTTQLFSNTVEILTPDSYSLNFADELCGVHLSLGHKQKGQDCSNSLGICNSFKPLTNIFPTEAPTATDEVNVGFSKLHLLLSPIQLAMEAFPLPRSVFESSKSDGYSFTKSSYTSVTSNSPLFGLDCEMCRMDSGRMEVTRIAIINEDFSVIYNTLVKPEGVVDDYLTRYSGVTKEMLDSVTTTLSDVQEHIQKLLPSNAILCGQSLNFDLHALQLIHPYIIDTSVIYNMSGNRTKKSSLKVLSSTFLKEVIQNGAEGHDPVEDCIAALKLVKKKLENGPHFGDAILSGHKHFEKSKILDPEAGNKSPLPISNNFFSKLKDASKSVCIAANEENLAKYPKIRLNSNIKTFAKPNQRQVLKHTLKSMSSFNFIISHIEIKPNDFNKGSLTTVDNIIKKLHAACSVKTLFVVVAPGLGRKNKNNAFENGLCMIELKNLVSNKKV